MSNRDRTTKYQIQLDIPGCQILPMSWNCKRDGRPNTANIRKFVRSWEDSTRPGGVNSHLGRTNIRAATILLNDGSLTRVVTYEAPGVHKAPGGSVYMFEVISEYNV
jgi:hypothetical protein